MHAFPKILFVILSLVAVSCFLYLPAAHAVEDDALELTPETFYKTINDPSKNVFVMFYAPWCGHCVRLKPKWAELAKDMQKTPDVIIAKIDASKHQEVADVYEVRGFPTLKFFTKGNKEGMTYQGARDFNSLTNFIKENI